MYLFKLFFPPRYMLSSRIAGSNGSSVFSLVFFFFPKKICSHSLKKNSFIYLFLTVLGLHCYAGFSLVAASRGCSPVECVGF